MSEDVRPIVIKRIKKTAGGHHGGAWKIAYADFVTAMMAFFLLMWLLGSTSKGDLKGLADYFLNPLKVSMSGGSGAGDATSIIKGGGKDLTESSGQVKKVTLRRRSKRRKKRPISRVPGTSSYARNSSSVKKRRYGNSRKTSKNSSTTIPFSDSSRTSC